MKKHPINFLIIITCMFIAFSAGFLVGRNQNHEPIYLSSLPVQAVHAASPTIPTYATEASTPVTFPVDINMADANELTALPGIGSTLAQRIIDYRRLNGNFERPEDLLNVEGIGTGKLEDILDYIIAGG